MNKASINTKLLCLIILSFFLTAVSVTILTNHQQKKIIDDNQSLIYSDKLNDIHGYFARAYQRLQATQMVEAYEDDFKQHALSEFRKAYFDEADQEVYPFIIDGKGNIIAHPNLHHSDETLLKAEFVQKAIRLESGEFNLNSGGTDNWYIFKHFESWDWVILYAVSIDIKYASSTKLRYTLIVFMSAITIVVVILVSIFITRFTRPISKLTAAAREIQQGAYDKQVEVVSHDEVGDLSIAFNDMTDQLRKTLKGLETEIAVRKKAEEDLSQHRNNLEEIVSQRTLEVETANEALRKSEVKFRELFNRMGSGVAIFDVRGNGEDFIFQDFNRAGEQIEAIKKEEIIGRSVCEVFPGVKDMALFEVFQRVWKTGKPEHHPASLYNDSRIQGWRENYVFKLPSNEVVSVYDDVTAQKQAEEALKKAKNSAEEASRAKSAFLANMSHEIRTPMNGIMGMTGVLLDTELSEEQRDCAQIVRGCTDSLMTIINDILDYSKIEAGKLDLEIIDFDLRTTLEEVGDLLAIKAHEKGLEFVGIVDDEVPSLLCGDPGRLRQILINLAGNAIKFTKHGEVVIRVTLEQEETSQAGLRFSVTDTGIGIPSDRMDRLFRSFSQVDVSTTREFGGTGLGLSICKQLVELMEGQIGVQSPAPHSGLGNADFGIKKDETSDLKSKIEGIGPGSTFWFTATFKKQPAGSEKKIVVPASIKGKHILIVDDNATNRYVLRETLKSWGCRFAEAAGGGEALEKLRGALSDEDPFEIAILDMLMPQMDGEMLGRKIKEDVELADTILVMLTSAGQRGDAARLKESGFAAYLTKPVKRSQLFDCLATVVGQQKGDEALPKRRMVTRHSLAEERKHGTRILLAEDNITNQKVALHMLKKFGYSADAVANGKEAVEALTCVTYDLVLMDVQMPVMDGFKATRAIRNWEANESTARSINQIPVIAMTANAMKGDRERCLEAGMDDYISKPVDPQQLLDKVRFWSQDSNKKDSDGANKVKEPALLPGEVKEDVPIDFDRALERAMGDREFLAEILQQFIADLPEQLETLETTVTDGDAEALAKQAHTLKGASANLAADEMSAAAFKLELMGKNGNLSGAPQALELLRNELEKLSEFVIAS